MTATVLNVRVTADMADFIKEKAVDSGETGATIVRQIIGEQMAKASPSRRHHIRKRAKRGRS